MNKLETPQKPNANLAKRLMAKKEELKKHYQSSNESQPSTGPRPEVPCPLPLK
ncbi:hypothetical protein SAMN05216167_14426 [Spirosoma endophyticum]|uniref:Uncharacterized protein n=1 Tax=Spirosoma endophyticum TaxID=662367 RepID=A0A1I2HID8_9BACT|nr:hypothetical protein SAMN05216167_14426 [Spirosoma endophyticum]